MLRLPWSSETMPHVVLDIIEHCNISCRGCYKRRTGRVRSVEYVIHNLEVAMSKSPLHTVTLAGAEPTLHPDLPEIVARLHRLGLKVLLATNGLALDDALLKRLKTAGLDMVLFHVDEGQTRPDLPARPSLDAVNALRAELAGHAAAHGVEAGLLATLHPEYVDRLPALAEFVLRSPHANYLLATVYVDVPAILTSLGREGGNGSFMRGQSGFVAPWAAGRMTTNGIAHVLRESLGLEPYAYLPSRLGLKGDKDFPSWLVYYVPVLNGTRPLRFMPLQASRLEQLGLLLRQWLEGRHRYYARRTTAAVAAHVLVNTLARRSVWQGLSLLASALRPSHRLGEKRLIFDNAPMLTSDGQVTCAEPCPHLTVKGDRLIPVCMSDLRCNPSAQTIQRPARMIVSSEPVAVAERQEV